jgi:hypothetical protein
MLTFNTLEFTSKTRPARIASEKPKKKAAHSGLEGGDGAVLRVLFLSQPPDRPANRGYRP